MYNIMKGGVTALREKSTMFDKMTERFGGGGGRERSRGLDHFPVLPFMPCCVSVTLMSLVFSLI